LAVAELAASLCIVCAEMIEAQDWIATRTALMITTVVTLPACPAGLFEV